MVSRHWPSLLIASLITHQVGSSHWPDMASRYFVIHAPSMATVVWKMIAPIAGEHMHHKVSSCASGGIVFDLF